MQRRNSPRFLAPTVLLTRHWPPIDTAEEQKYEVTETVDGIIYNKIYRGLGGKHNTKCVQHFERLGTRDRAVSSKYRTF